MYPGNSSGVRNTDLIVRHLLGEDVFSVPATAAGAEAEPPGGEETYLATRLTSPVWTNWGLRCPKETFR